MGKDYKQPARPNKILREFAIYNRAMAKARKAQYDRRVDKLAESFANIDLNDRYDPKDGPEIDFPKIRNPKCRIRNPKLFRNSDWLELSKRILRISRHLSFLERRIMIHWIPLIETNPMIVNSCF